MYRLSCCGYRDDKRLQLANHIMVYAPESHPTRTLTSVLTLFYVHRGSAAMELYAILGGYNTCDLLTGRMANQSINQSNFQVLCRLAGIVSALQQQAVLNNKYSFHCTMSSIATLQVGFKTFLQKFRSRVDIPIL